MNHLDKIKALPEMSLLVHRDKTIPAIDFPRDQLYISLPHDAKDRQQDYLASLFVSSPDLYLALYELVATQLAWTEFDQACDSGELQLTETEEMKRAGEIGKRQREAYINARRVLGKVWFPEEDRPKKDAPASAPAMRVIEGSTYQASFEGGEGRYWLRLSCGHRVEGPAFMNAHGGGTVVGLEAACHVCSGSKEVPVRKVKHVSLSPMDLDLDMVVVLDCLHRIKIPHPPGRIETWQEAVGVEMPCEKCARGEPL